MEKLCKQCGEPIRRPFEAWVDRSVFCGNACKHAFQKVHPPRPRIERTIGRCEVCGKAFPYLPSQRKGAHLYCTYACKHVGQRRVMTGRQPTNGVYKNAVSFRASIRKRLTDRCAICGWAEASCDVCHIDARKNGGADRLDNIVMLCPNHHRLFDHGRLPLEVVREAAHRAMAPSSASQ